MDVYEAIRERYSVRSYRPDPIPQDKLMRLMEAARLAPSAKNRQPWKFILVTDQDKRDELAEIARNSFVSEAPVCIAAVCTEKDWMLSSGVHAYAVDVAIAIDHITLAAVEEDLGTCWIGAFDQEPAKELLEIPDEHIIVELLTLGYPADEPPQKKSRKNLEEIICWEKFSE